MSRYVAYSLEDGSELLIEISEPDQAGVKQAGLLGDVMQKSQVTFEQSMDKVQVSILQMQKQFHKLQADEVEVKFGLKATGEAGNNTFAIGKIGLETNYEVTLKWKKKAPVELNRRIRKLKKEIAAHP